MRPRALLLLALPMLVSAEAPSAWQVVESLPPYVATAADTLLVGTDTLRLAAVVDLSRIEAHHGACGCAGSATLASVPRGHLDVTLSGVHTVGIAESLWVATTRGHQVTVPPGWSASGVHEIWIGSWPPAEPAGRVVLRFRDASGSVRYIGCTPQVHEALPI